MAPIPVSTQKLWYEYTNSFQAKYGKPNFEASLDHEDWPSFELRYNGRTLQYTVELIGDQPADGYPLLIGLHGGGRDSIKNNNSEWKNMTSNWYRRPVDAHVKKTGEGAVYIALRGVSSYDKKTNTFFDDWNLHFQDESYVLLQRLIRGFFLPIPEEVIIQKLDGPFRTDFVKDRPFVDPNRVYLLGFSAGGDGAFQHAARLPDLFSAVSAAGGHPNGVPFINTANLPLCISSGEKDTLPSMYNLADGDSSGAKDRAQEIVRDSIQLENLRKSVREQLYNTVPKAFQSHVYSYLFYPHDCVIVQGKGHNSWARPNMSNTPQRVLTNLKAWLLQQENKNIKVDGADASADKVVNLVEWACSELSSTPKTFVPRVRNPLPQFVDWNLATRPTAPSTDAPGNEKADWTPKNTLYWLYLRSNDISKLSSLTAQIRAAYDKPTNSVWVESANDYLGILLNENMVDFKKDVWVCIGKGSDTAQKIKITPSEKLRRETLWQRGDPSWVFDALVYFVKDGAGKWIPKVTDTLSVDALPSPKSKL
ncbi:hypothetical protein EK21DRAFT_89463 [Setomelanomma holmii]|uniref:Uncharacterized protein n=1 Tax=Setomelanomma holmii TaxID=210430 RepID=A0A9P4LNF5_9PLEO|nr:hypothetical protein EK21DRAFT_89463 [Setomelanomma holmii]